MSKRNTRGGWKSSQTVNALRFVQDCHEIKPQTTKGVTFFEPHWWAGSKKKKKEHGRESTKKETHNNKNKKGSTALCLLGTNNGRRVVYGQHGDHAVTSPWTEICGTHLSAVVWQSRLLSLHLPWHNQQKLWLVGPPVTYTDKLQQPIRAQKGCPDHVCGHEKDGICCFSFPTPAISKIAVWTFWVNVSIAGWVKHMEGGSLLCVLSAGTGAEGGRFTCSNFQPSDMVDTICVSSSSWHCSTRYTCFTGT